MVTAVSQRKSTSLRQTSPQFCSSTECPRQPSGSGDKSSFLALVPTGLSLSPRAAGMVPQAVPCTPPGHTVHTDADVNSARGLCRAAALPLVFRVLNENKKNSAVSPSPAGSHSPPALDVNTRSWFLSTVDTVIFISVPGALFGQNPRGMMVQEGEMKPIPQTPGQTGLPSVDQAPANDCPPLPRASSPG